MTKLKVIRNDTCFSAHERFNLTCNKNTCKHWFKNKQTLNCVLIHAKNGPEKQEKIGAYFGLTRMRVCQIEKSILSKIKGGKGLEEIK